MARECITSTFKVGKYKCNMSVSKIGITVEWLPDMPGKLCNSHMRQYEEGKDKLMQHAADILNLNLMSQTTKGMVVYKGK